MTLADWYSRDPAEWLAEGDDERARMGRIAGGLWTVAALVGIVATFMPGAEHEGVGWVLALSAAVLLYGLSSLAGLWDGASLRSLAIGMVVTVPVVGLALFLTGASISFIEPLLVCSLLYAAFFFPARWAWPLTIELLLVAGTPLLYDKRAIEHAYLPRYLALSAGFLAVTAVMIRVKRRLVAAERSQREIANRDALTGIPNRRFFDCTLRRELAARSGAVDAGGERTGSRLAVLIVDIDDFKSINDAHGHQVGDDVLRGAAARMQEALRDSDTLARIGGDEFAVIAPGAGGEEARELAGRVQRTVSAGAPGSDLPTPRVSVGWGVFPADGDTLEALVGSADERLLALKHRGRPAGEISVSRTGGLSTIG